MRPAARRRPGLFPAVAALCCLARLAPRAAAGGRQGAGAGGLVPCAGSARQVRADARTHARTHQRAPRALVAAG